MTWDKTVADLVARYLFAVEQDLPRPLRDDVARELRTLIEDKLEDRAKTLNQPIDTALATFVLHEIGRPRDVAQRYDPTPQYLVGPRFYPAFVRIAKIALPGLAGLLLLATVVGAVNSPQGPAGLFSVKTWLEFMEHYFQAAITLLGEAVVVLAIIERTKVGDRIASKRDWDMRDLPELPDAHEEPLSVAGVAVDVCLTVLVAVWLNLFPRWGVIFMVTNGQPRLIPLSDFGIHLPMLVINAWLGLQLTLKLVMLAQRRWTLATRWAQAAVGFLAAAVLFDVVAHSTLTLPNAMPALAPALQGLNFLLYAAPFVALISPVKRTARLLRPRPAVVAAQA
jgi:hypothetical protein